MKRAFRHVRATGSTAGPRCTDWMPRIFTGSCWGRGSAGARYHGVAEEGVPFREIARVIGRRLKVPAVGKTPEEAANHFGWFAHFAATDSPASSRRARELLGWQPKQPG